jgi:hypothetical protein
MDIYYFCVRPGGVQSQPVRPQNGATFPAMLTASLIDTSGGLFKLDYLASYQDTWVPAAPIPPATPTGPQRPQDPQHHAFPPLGTGTILKSEEVARTNGIDPLRVGQGNSVVGQVTFTAPAQPSDFPYAAILVIKDITATNPWKPIRIGLTAVVAQISLNYRPGFQISQNSSAEVPIEIVSNAAEDVVVRFGFPLNRGGNGIALEPAIVGIPGRSAITTNLRFTAGIAAPLGTQELPVVASAYGGVFQLDCTMQATVLAAPLPVVAIVLSGGGSKGDFEVGVVRYLYDNVLPKLNKTQPDILCGTSVGAINAAKLAEGGRAALSQLEDIWLKNLREWRRHQNSANRYR